MSEQEKILVPEIEKPIAGPISPELPSTPERPSEKVNDVAPDSSVVPTAAPVSSLPEITLTPELERAKAIEKILEEDLSEVYFNLPEDKREQFRISGEKTVLEINHILASAKIKVDKIIKLIRNWLLIIPGVNKFFLEQEAKLKTDRILKLNDKL